MTPGPERLAARWAAWMHGTAPAERAPAPAPAVPPAAPPEGSPSPVPEKPALTREQIRARRVREVAAHTVSIRQMGLRELAREGALYPEQPGVDYERPKTRGECQGTERPCPFASCKYHLYLDVTSNGSIKLNFPDIEPWEMAESCVLDLADRDGLTLEQVGVILNLTRERIRQIEAIAHRKLRVEAGNAIGRLAEIVQVSGFDGKRRLPLVRVEEDDLEEEEDHDAEDSDDE